MGQKFLETTAKEGQTFLVLKSKLFLSVFLERNYRLKDWNHVTSEDFSDLFNGLSSSNYFSEEKEDLFQ